MRAAFNFSFAAVSAIPAANLNANNFESSHFAAKIAAAFAAASPAGIARNQIPLTLIIAPSNSKL